MRLELSAGADRGQQRRHRRQRVQRQMDPSDVAINIAHQIAANVPTK